VTTAVLEAQLGLDRGQAARWLRYDAETVTLEEHAITPRDDCPVCSNHAGESTCHPTLDS
jgi:hypothetical protein